MIVYMIVMGVGAVNPLEHMVQIGNYANKIGVTRHMTKAECQAKVKKIKSFMVKHKHETVAVICRENWE